MDEDLEDLGTEVFLYDPEADEFTQLNENSGPGADPLEKYSWSTALFGTGSSDGPDLYVGTFSVQSDPIGEIMLGVWGQAQFGTGSIPVQGLLQGLGTTQPTAGFIDFLTTDIPNTLDSDGGAIWKLDFSTGLWTEVFNSDLSNGEFDDEDIGIRDLVSYDGKLYASTTTNLIFNFLNGGDNTAKIFVSDTGQPGSFVPLTGGPLDDENTASIRALTVIEDPDNGQEILAVGTENVAEGGEVWFYTENGGWELVTKFDGEDGRPYSAVVAEVEQIDGKIYAGNWLPYGLYELTDSGPVDVGPTPPPNDEDNGVMQIIEFDGYIYVGSVDYEDGASLFRIPVDEIGQPGATWETITTTGFQDVASLSDWYGPDQNRATYVWQLAVVEDTLYFGDFSERAALGQIVHEGSDKTPVLSMVPETSNPFLFDNGPAYGIRKLQPIQLGEKGILPTHDQSDPDHLIIGTADQFDTRPEDPLAGIIDPSGELVIGHLFRPSLLKGTDDEDTILGGFRRDTIVGNDEDDFIFGDVTLGTRGDLIGGGAGEDIIIGSNGHDTILGEDDEDFIVGGYGRDYLEGGDGVDLILGDGLLDGELGELIAPMFEEMADGMMEEAMMSGNFNSSIALLSTAIEELVTVTKYFGLQNDTIKGNDGNDILIGALGRHEVSGGEGNDIIYGGEGWDTVNGGIGDDIIDGGTGRDVISGDSGDDVLITGEGNDWIYTGEGGDRILAQDGSDTPGIDIGVDKVYDFTRGEDKIDLSEFFQNPANPFLPTIPIAQPLAYDFDDQIGAALSPTSLGVKVDLSLIDGGTNDGGIDGPDGSGVIHVLGVSELSEDDFVVTSQLVPVDLLL